LEEIKKPNAMLKAILCSSLMMIINWYMQLLCKLEYKRRLGQENRWHLRQSIFLGPLATRTFSVLFDLVET
jgi:L-asparagine transporter-like permease